MRLFTIAICCAAILGISSVSAQSDVRFEYQIVAQLEISQASAISWSPDGTRLAVVSWPTIQIWDTESWELLLTIEDANVNTVEWNPTGDMLASVRGGRNESVVIWDPLTGEILREMTQQAPAIDRPYVIVMHDLTWHPDGSTIATDSGLWSDLLLIWNPASDDNPASLVAGYPEATGSDYMDIADLEWSGNGLWLLADGSDGNSPTRSILRLYDAVTGETIRTIFPGFNPIWGPNDEQFAGTSLIGPNYVVNIWDTETGEVLSTFVAHELGGALITWNFSANFIAGVRGSGEMRADSLLLWDVQTGIRYNIADIQTSGARDIEWQPNGNHLAISDLFDGVVILNFGFLE